MCSQPGTDQSIQAHHCSAARLRALEWSHHLPAGRPLPAPLAHEHQPMPLRALRRAKTQREIRRTNPRARRLRLTTSRGRYSDQSPSRNDAAIGTIAQTVRHCRSLAFQPISLNHQIPIAKTVDHSPSLNVTCATPQTARNKLANNSAAGVNGSPALWISTMSGPGKGSTIGITQIAACNGDPSAHCLGNEAKASDAHSNAKVESKDSARVNSTGGVSP